MNRAGSIYRIRIEEFLQISAAAASIFSVAVSDDRFLRLYSCPHDQAPAQVREGLFAGQQLERWKGLLQIDVLWAGDECPLLKTAQEIGHKPGIPSGLLPDPGCCFREESARRKAPQKVFLDVFLFKAVQGQFKALSL